MGSDAQMASVVARLLTRPEERRAIARHNATEPSDLAWSRTGPRAEEVYRRAGAVPAAAPPSGSPLALGW